MVENSLNAFQNPVEEKKHKGIFAHEKAKQEVSPVSQELESTINRLRVLEERYTNIQTELRVTEENMIRRHKKLTTDIKTLTLDINELRKEIDDIKNDVGAYEFCYT
jgi:flagellar biosynthesis chaperone FliJ